MHTLQKWKHLCSERGTRDTEKSFKVISRTTDNIITKRPGQTAVNKTQH